MAGAKMDWVEAIVARCESAESASEIVADAVSEGREMPPGEVAMLLGHGQKMYKELPRLASVVLSADRLVRLVADYQRDVVDDPDGSDWVARMAAIDEAVDDYQQERKAP